MIQTITRRIRTALTQERGSLAGSFIFVLFVSITMTAIVTAVTASLTASTTMNSLTSANNGANLGMNSYLDSAIRAAPSPGNVCSDTQCGQETSTTDSNGVRSVTLQGTDDTRATTNRIQTLRQVAGTMISGYDSMGNPVWSTQADTTPYRFTNLISRGNSSCAIDPDKAAWCWGANDQGQLGDGSTVNKPAPVKVQGTAKFVSLVSAIGNTFCGLSDDGKAWCWGNNTSGQLGTGSATVGTSSLAPVNPTGNHIFTSLFQGATTTCGIDTTQQTWCWGANPGNGTAGASPDPAAVAGTHNFTALTLDASTACGLESGGTVFCWATTPTGRTGTDPAPANGNPVEIAGGRTYTQVRAANEDSTDATSLLCALDSASQAWCWGTNSTGQLGNGTTTDSLTPVAVTGSHSFQALVPSPSAVCGIDTANHAWCWGDNSSGELGIGSTTAATSPAAVDPGTTYSTITAATSNGKTFCALATDGSAKCWGENGYSQAQSGSTAPVTSPAPVAGFKGLRSLSTGAAFSCVTDARYETSCWGHNDVGQTGGGATATTSPPLPAARKSITPSAFAGYLKGGQ
jgi:alpha-tubulin suppressor-like RCC1 family protein